MGISTHNYFDLQALHNRATKLLHCYSISIFAIDQLYLELSYTVTPANRHELEQEIAQRTHTSENILRIYLLVLQTYHDTQLKNKLVN